MSKRPRILVPIYEPLDGPMSALATRRLEISCALAEDCDVTLASTVATAPFQIRGVAVEPAGSLRHFRRLLDEHEFLYTLSIYPKHAFHVARSGIKVILDLYAPVAFECLEAYPEMPVDLLDRIHRQKIWWTARQIEMASVCVVANSRQADFWIGVANQLEVLDAARIRRDPSLADMIIEIPIGVPPGTPERMGTPLRTKLGLSLEDFIFLWSSRILAWQDPAVLIEAMRLLRDTDPGIKLVFLGLGDPAPPGRASWLDAAALRTREARQLAAAADLTDRNIFFIDERIKYHDLGVYYRDCDAAVATYPNSLETRMCLGTRLADYVWAELPIAVTGGPLQREFVEGQGIGYCSRPGIAGELADTMLRIARDVRSSGWDPGAFSAAKQRHSWQVLTSPLVEWCRRHSGQPRRPRSGIRELLSATRFLVNDRLCRAGFQP